MSVISRIDLHSSTYPGASYRVLFYSVSVLFLSLIILPHIVFSFQSALVFLEEDGVNFYKTHISFKTCVLDGSLLVGG